MMYYRVLQIYLFGGRAEYHRVQCAFSGTLRHIMSACPRALGDGRYCWRHDHVLRTVANTVDAAIHANSNKPEVRPIYFVKAGECPPSLGM